jgi:hypothetical protein
MLAYCVIICLFSACTNELIPLYENESEGKVIIQAYSVDDSLQIRANGKNLNINDNTDFIREIKNTYQFVLLDGESRQLDIIRKSDSMVLKSYTFTPENAVDTISFFCKEDLWIDNPLSFAPGKLSSTANCGYRFIFPNMNRYSQSGYKGQIDGIIRSITGQQLAIVENIGQETFSSFAEFSYVTPPILKMELVKHGTTESYIPGRKVFVDMSIQKGKLKLIVLEETAGEDGLFSKVTGSIDLTVYFSY